MLLWKGENILIKSKSCIWYVWQFILMTFTFNINIALGLFLPTSSPELLDCVIDLVGIFWMRGSFKNVKYMKQVP